MFTFDSVPLAEFRIDNLTEKIKENCIYLVSMAENEEREVRDVIEKNDEYYDPLLDDIDIW